MSSDQSIFSTRTRKRKAYWTAFLVFMSYFWLNLKRKIFGQSYFDKKINKLHQKNAERIKIRVQELQGLFIKMGQLISNLSNVLPTEFREPLGELQDHIKAKPFSEVAQTIQKELGDMPANLFTSFDENALAAASIGQVHRAKIGNKEVVVKIQHANIDAIAHADLEILQNLVKLHAFFMDMKGLDHMYVQVKQMIEEELDYKMEAKSMELITDNLSLLPELNIVIPEVFPTYSTSKILVSTYCEGTKIGDVITLKEWGLDLDDIVKRLVELYCKMILVDGFYHADPHPGNILVNKKGEIILLDFGAVAQLNSSMKAAIPELIEAIIRNDTEATVTALRKMGFLGTDKASVIYVEKLIEMFRNFLQEEVQFDGMNFQNIKLNSGVSSIASLVGKIDLREVSNNIRIPKDYILLNRTIVLLLGNAFQLAPELNTLDVVRPYVKKHILGKDGGFTDLIVNTIKNQLTSAIAIPNELAKFLKSANKGEIEVGITGLEKGMEQLYYLGQQFLYGALTLVFGYLMLEYEPVEQFWLWLNRGAILFFSLSFFRAFWRS